MDKEYDYGKLRGVGSISYRALEKARELVKEGAGRLKVAQELESFFRGNGYEMAFPVNISVNETAAHFSPGLEDTYKFSAKDIVKIDLGARKDVYLSDCAITIDLSGSNGKLVEASEEALEAAISKVRAGREVREIGREIEAVAKNKGAKPIKNLGGHGISRDELHSRIFIPNYDNGDNEKLEDGEVIAIEPFMTDGYGAVEEGSEVQIFEKKDDVAPRSQEAREVFSHIQKNYLTYPFAFSWLQKEFSSLGEFKLRRALNELAMLGGLELYPVLIEKKSGMVAQTEKELIVTKDSCEVVTK